MMLLCCCSCRSVVVDFCPDLLCSSGFELFLVAEKDLQVSLNINKYLYEYNNI